MPQMPPRNFYMTFSLAFACGAGNLQSSFSFGWAELGLSSLHLRTGQESAAVSENLRISE